MPYVGNTGQPAASARRTRPGGIGPPPSSTARNASGGGALSVASRRRASCTATRETWLTGFAAICAARSEPLGATTGTPEKGARQTTPLPPTWAMEGEATQPVAGGRNWFHASALATRARHVRIAPLARPVVPDVATMTAGAGT